MKTTTRGEATGRSDAAIVGFDRLESLAAEHRLVGANGVEPFTLGIPAALAELEERGGVARVGIGVVVVLLAEIGMIGLVRSAEYGELACGLGLAACPFVMGYADDGELRFWHFGLGGLVAALAALQLWQDWSLSDSELAAHADS